MVKTVTLGEYPVLPQCSLAGLPQQLFVLHVSVLDSLCRDGTDVQYMQYFKQKLYNFTTNTLKAYLST